jgi:hypothetical protein
VDDLNYVYVASLSNEECRLAFGSQVTDNVVCVDGNYNEGTCKVSEVKLWYSMDLNHLDLY